MESRKYLSLAIHTPRHATVLQNMLEKNGINVHLEAIDSREGAPMKVMIDSEDLDKALDLAESENSRIFEAASMKLAGMSGDILIPVDFSENSFKAIKVGFELASSMNMKPIILHAFISPIHPSIIPNDTMLDNDENVEEEIEDFKTMQVVEQDAHKKMASLSKRIRESIKQKELPDIQFSTLLREGIPEEVILDYSRVTPPFMIVMATRGMGRKAEELVGSVTAEVVDSCRVPLFIVPENFELLSLSSISKVVFFCSLDRHDMLTMDICQRLLNYASLHITLIPIEEKLSSVNNLIRQEVLTIETFFRNNYPNSSFSSKIIPAKTLRTLCEEVTSSGDAQLLVVPNKKRNIFSRLFNPSIAHRFLFENEIPMLVLPA